MNHIVTHNEDLRKALNDRRSIFETFIDIEEMDDERLEKYCKWLKWYDSLSLLDKDIYYLCLLYSVADVARFFDCSYSFIYKRKKKLFR